MEKPDLNKLLDMAVSIAISIHNQQTDRYGQPYILHVMRVMGNGRTLEEKITGALHDVVEDSDMTTEDLRREGFPDNIVKAVDALSRRVDESYEDFIQRIANDKLAVRVKLHDLQDNMDIRRMDEVNDKDIDRLNRYIKAYRLLSGE